MKQYSDVPGGNAKFLQKYFSINYKIPIFFDLLICLELIQRINYGWSHHMYKNIQYGVAYNRDLLVIADNRGKFNKCFNKE